MQTAGHFLPGADRLDGDAFQFLPLTPAAATNQDDDGVGKMDLAVPAARFEAQAVRGQIILEQAAHAVGIARMGKRSL